MNNLIRTILSVAPLAGVQGDRVQSSLLTLRIVPFHTKLKAQTHMQVTEEEGKIQARRGGRKRTHCNRKRIEL